LAERIRQDLASILAGKNLDEYNRVKELHQKTTQRLGSVIGDDSTEKEEKNVVSDLEREQKEVKRLMKSVDFAKISGSSDSDNDKK